MRDTLKKAYQPRAFFSPIKMLMGFERSWFGFVLCLVQSRNLNPISSQPVNRIKRL